MQKLLSKILAFAGADVRHEDLFSDENIFAKGKSVIKGLTVCLSDFFLY